MRERSIEHFAVKTGNLYYTWLQGYSKNIYNAMFVKKDVKLKGNQRLVKITATTIIEEVFV